MGFPAAEKTLTSHPCSVTLTLAFPSHQHLQEVEGGVHLVLYVSRKLTPAADKQEALAIKWTVKELRYYLAVQHQPCSLAVDGIGQGHQCVRNLMVPFIAGFLVPGPAESWELAWECR